MKEKIFGNKLSDMKIKFYGNVGKEHVILSQKILRSDEHTIVLGNYPNTRFELIEKMLNHFKFFERRGKNKTKNGIQTKSETKDGDSRISSNDKSPTDADSSTDAESSADAEHSAEN